MSKKTDSGWIIPADWLLPSGEWTCYSIAWPSSAAWELHLRSLLYSLTRGREWDKATGTITTAQAIAWEIFERNSPLIICGECPECPECPECEECPECPPDLQNGPFAAFGTCAALDSEENDMGQVVTNVYIADGALVVEFGPCCVKTFALATATQGEAPDIGDDPLNPHGDTLNYYPCGKAWAVVETLYAVAGTIWDQTDQLPIYWVRNVKNAYPEIELTDQDIVAAVLYALDLVAVGSILDQFGVSRGVEEVTFDASTKGNILCQAVALMTSDSSGMDSDQYQQFKDTVTGQWGFNLLERLFWTWCIDAIGRGDFDNIAKLGALDNTRDCTCPEGYLFGSYIDYEEYDWYEEIDFRVTAPPVGSYYPGAGGYTPGEGIFGEILDAGGRNQVQITMPILNAGSLTGTNLRRLGIRWRTNAGDEYRPYSDQKQGTNVGDSFVPVETLDTLTSSKGGSFSINWSYEDNIATATTMYARIDISQSAMPWDETDSENSAIIEAVFFAGVGVKPDLWP